MHTVYLLIAANGAIVSVYESETDAEQRRDKFNADPFLDAVTLDPDAPYRVEAWAVKPSEARLANESIARSMAGKP